MPNESVCESGVRCVESALINNKSYRKEMLQLFDLKLESTGKLILLQIL